MYMLSLYQGKKSLYQGKMERHELEIINEIF